MLSDGKKIATLSRGYGRKSKGYREVRVASSADEVGDEPLQFKTKFPAITVAVAERRVDGIARLAGHDIIILDDAYQHRSVKPGFSVLLFEYSTFSKTQWFLPTGNLREPWSGRKRAHCIVVTKCPPDLSERERIQITRKLRPGEHQNVLFSFLKYEELRSVSGDEKKLLESLSGSTHVLLLTGIANPKPLLDKLRVYTSNIRHYSYPDHYAFTPENIAKIAEDYHALDVHDKVIVTTEKDLQRLKGPEFHEHLSNLPVYYLPIKAAFDEADQAFFDQLILNYVNKHSAHDRIH